MQVTVAGSGSITGWTLSASIMPKYSTAPLVTVTSGSGIAITDAANRVYEITFTDTQTDIPPGEYRFESRRTNDGSEAVLVEGVCTIKPSSQA